MKACRSSAIAMARRASILSKGGLRLTATVTPTLSGTVSQIACGAWLWMSFSKGTVISCGKVMSNLPAIKPSTAVERFGMIVYSMPSR